MTYRDWWLIAKAYWYRLTSWRYRRRLDKRGHEPWRERLEWLAIVEELERKMGAPIFSNATKMQVASGIPASEIKREMERIYNDLTQPDDYDKRFGLALWESYA